MIVLAAHHDDVIATAGSEGVVAPAEVDLVVAAALSAIAAKVIARLGENGQCVDRSGSTPGTFFSNSTV